MKKGLSKSCYLFFSTLSNPTRLAILELLREEPKNVTQMSKALNLDQTMISHNLKPLVRCHFISVERRWRERIYSINEDTMEAIFKIIDNHMKNYCPKGGKCLDL